MWWWCCCCLCICVCAHHLTPSCADLGATGKQQRCNRVPIRTPPQFHTHVQVLHVPMIRKKPNAYTPTPWHTHTHTQSHTHTHTRTRTRAQPHTPGAARAACRSRASRRAPALLPARCSAWLARVAQLPAAAAALRASQVRPVMTPLGSIQTRPGARRHRHICPGRQKERDKVSRCA